jgi:hypothetical protein
VRGPFAFAERIFRVICFCCVGGVFGVRGGIVLGLDLVFGLRLFYLRTLLPNAGENGVDDKR